jgi:hypothetical protein
MGTSSARRAPSSRLWRLAKAAATRYLSPEALAPATAGEVVSRYLAALGQGAGQETSALAAFRETRKVAQDLGAFTALAASQGWPAALRARGLADLAGHPPEVLAPGLSAELAGSGGGLETAVARASLASVLRQGFKETDPGRWVDQFLAMALYSRLALDLGESLEAAAPGFRPLQHGLKALKAWIEKNLAAPLPEPPPPPEHWRNLAGWSWVTARLEAWLRELIYSREKTT